MPTLLINYSTCPPIKHKYLCYVSLLISTLYQQTVYAQNKPVRAEKVLSVVTADWNNDGAFDRAILIESETEADQTDLLVYLSDASGTMQLAIDKKNIAWRGAMWGTQPTLETTQHASLAIIAMNDAIGRNRWNLKLTAAYRNNTFFIAGYTYSERDTLALSSESNCDVNFLSGKAIHNNKPFKTSAKPVPLLDWSETSVPKECR